MKVMAGSNERIVKALKEVWRRAENSLCADCGKPGESPSAARGKPGEFLRTVRRKVRSRELPLVSSSYLVLALWTA